MAQNIVVSLPELCDLALCAPEPGAVNFNILHTLLHVIIQQLNKTDVQVEFKGDDNERMQNILAAKSKGPSLNLVEYVVVGGEKKEKKKRKSKEEVLQTMEIKRDSKDKMSQTSQHSLQRLIVVESTDEKNKIPTVAVTSTNFQMVVKDVDNLKNKVQELIDLPGNLGLIEAIQGGEKSSPVLEMYQIMNLSKRIEAAEDGVQKIATLVEDVVKNNGKIGIQQSSDMLNKAECLRRSFEGGRPSTTRIDQVERRLSKLEKTVTDPQGAGAVLNDPTSASISESISDVTLEGKILKKMIIPHAMAIIQHELEEIKKQMSDLNIKEFVSNLNEVKMKFETVDDEEGADVPLPVRVNQLYIKYQETIEQVNTLDTMYNNQMKIANEQIAELQKQMEGFGNGKRGFQSASEAPEGCSGVPDGKDRVGTLESELTELVELANELQKKHDMRQIHMDAMLEQIELLKIVKADREDLEDALGNKADACQINRKVSLDKFESACNDINKNLEDALEKLSEQEAIWQEIIENMQKDMSCKLDKSEVDPLRDFVNNKLRQLQEKLKILAELKKEREAAGTKSKVLRDVNCISCDKDVVMKRQIDPSTKGKSPMLPPTKSMAPYLAYELDQLRNQQKTNYSRNLNYFERAIKDNKGAKDPANMCNRYCGGSHTVTTPQQRVTRMGHFMDQWGPEVAPIEDEYIRGLDNHLYKSRDEEKLKMTIISTGKKRLDSAQGDGFKFEEKRFSKDFKNMESKIKDKMSKVTQAVAISMEAKAVLEEKAEALVNQVMEGE